MQLWPKKWILHRKLRLLVKLENVGMLQERLSDIKASRHLKLIVGERKCWKVLKGKFADSAVTVWYKILRKRNALPKIKYSMKVLLKHFGLQYYSVFSHFKDFFHQAVRYNQREVQVWWKVFLSVAGAWNEMSFRVPSTQTFLWVSWLLYSVSCICVSTRNCMIIHGVFTQPFLIHSKYTISTNSGI